MAIYFAQDGSYGNANGLIILDALGWSSDDWERIENASDFNRLDVAIDIAQENGGI